MNLSRRGLLGMFAASAGAAIITTPGLLMSVKSLRGGISLIDYAKRILDPEAQRIAELLNASNELMNDLPWQTGNIKFRVTPNPGDTVTINGKRWDFLLQPSDMTREPIGELFRGIHVRLDETLAADEWRLG